MYKENNYKEIKDMEAKDRFILIGVISIIIMFFSPFIKIGIEVFNDIFGDSILSRVIAGFSLIIIIMFIIKKIKKSIRLANSIENGTVQKKEVKIVGFEYSKSHEDSGYYIILSDGEKKYKSFYHKGAKIIGKTDEELKKDKFYEKNGITLDLHNRNIIIEQLEKKIFELESQKKDANIIKTLKVDSKITELQNKKNDLEPCHLHSKKGDYYIGDKDTVLVDLEDKNNYILKSEK